jgi:hypothetical protein
MMMKKLTISKIRDVKMLVMLRSPQVAVVVVVSACLTEPQ